MARPKYRPGSVITLEVKPRSGKKPLVQYLAARLGMPLAWAADLIDDGAVDLDGLSAWRDTAINLSAGPHALVVRIPDAWPRHMAPTEMDLDILYEDADLLILSKPPGIVVHPARGHLNNQTLQNGVRHRYRDRLGEEDYSIGPPHRLDKDTSGVIIYAITRTAYVDLVAQFAACRMEKSYLAVVESEFPEQVERSGRSDGNATFLCDGDIGEDPERHGLGKVVPDGEGRRARTDFRLVERGAGWSLVLARPFTGRPHQIRIHAAHAGFPILGDADYNPEPGRFGACRQLLHAASVTLTHPRTREPMTVSAPVAPDMTAFLDSLRASHPGNGDCDDALKSIYLP